MTKKTREQSAAKSKNKIAVTEPTLGPFAAKPQIESLDLRCYCCGDPIGGEVALVSMQLNGTDRVFLMSPQHAGRASGCFEIVKRGSP
jgi:hypothetical protein